MTLGASFARLWGITMKEFIQLRRDRLTFGMIVGIPIMQLLLFGFAINSDPKHLPTAINVQDNSVFSRTFIRSLENTGYFQIVQQVQSEAEADRLLAEGEVQFVVNIPTRFSRQLVRGERPAILLEADATDPAATSNALASLVSVGQSVLNRDLTGSLAKLRPTDAPFEVRIHRRYNAEGITQYNIVPGLMGVILTMTMVLMTGLAMTRERERGTFENLLATPAKPLEVMVGKIVPYIMIGLVQMTLILLAAQFIFGVPIARQSGAAVCGVAAVHRRQPDAGDDVFHHCAQSVAGDADDVLFLPAVDFAVRVHVPVPGDAGMGAGDWQCAAADAFSAAGARDSAEGQLAGGTRGRRSGRSCCLRW